MTSKTIIVENDHSLQVLDAERSKTFMHNKLSVLLTTVLKQKNGREGERDRAGEREGENSIDHRLLCQGGELTSLVMENVDW